MKSRQTEVLSDKSVTRYRMYFVPSMHAMKRLREERDAENTSNLREIIAQNSAYDFINDLMSIYESLVTELADSILERYEGTQQPAETTGQEKEAERHIPKPSGEGKRFTKVEEAFIKSRVDMGPKRLREEFNERFPHRSYRSIAIKKYRVQKRYAKQNSNRKTHT